MQSGKWCSVVLLAVFGWACSNEQLADRTPGSSQDPEAALEQLFGGARSLRAVAVFEPRDVISTTDVAFNPARPDELWGIQRRAPNDLPCTEADASGCADLIGRTLIISAATSASPSSELKVDPNGWHFMRRPTSIAFGDPELFATCHEARTGNYSDDTADYIGPTLWSSDPAIYAIQPPGKNGSHLDMLHETPFCMGLAHERGNAYFAFNGQIGAIDHYDFREPHEVGGEDHRDGRLRRYVEGQLARVAELPSHLAYDEATRELFIADTGNARIAVLDTASGSTGARLDVNEPIAEYVAVDGAEIRDFVVGTLSAPSGLSLFEGLVLVADNATSRILVFDRQAHQVAGYDTGLPAGTLAGIAIGPDDKIYAADLLGGRVLRLEPVIE
jgi:hypothetical protein